MNFAAILSQIQRAWNNLTVTQQRVILGMSVLTAVGLGFLVVWASRPEYKPLFTDLTTSDASAVVGKLEERNVRYRLADGGRTVLVPRSEVDALRVKMAHDKVIKGTHVGFEIFDTSPLGQTDAMLRMNRLRAQQGELERTISAMDGVETARVHLAQPEETLYLDSQREPTASVIVKLKAGQQLTPAQVEAITYLVSYAVEGLSPDSVSVMDNRLNLLTGPPDPVTGARSLATKQIEAQHQHEEQIERKIQTMLASVLGPHKSVVRVRTELNFDRTQTTKKLVQPGESGEGVPLTKKQTEETYKGTGVPPGGVPGATSNVGVPPARAAGNTQSSYSRLEDSIQYEVSMTTENVDKTPGEIKRLSVAVVLNNLPKGVTMRNMEEMVASVAGVHRARGDQVSVAVMPFDNTYLLAERQALEQAQRQQLYLAVARGALMALVVLVALLLGTRLFAPPMRRRSPSVLELPEPRALPTAVGEAAEEREALPSVPALEEAPQELEMLSLSEEEMQVQRLALEHPAKVAQLLRAWLHE